MLCSKIWCKFEIYLLTQVWPTEPSSLGILKVYFLGTFTKGVLYQCCSKFYDLQLSQYQHRKILDLRSRKFKITKLVSFGQISHADRKAPKPYANLHACQSTNYQSCSQQNCLQVCQYKFHPNLNRIKVMSTITETYLQKTGFNNLHLNQIWTRAQMHVIAWCIMMNVACMMKDYALEMPEHHNPPPLKKSRPEILMWSGCIS